MRCLFFIVEIVNESVNLIQMLKQNRNYYHHDGEQLGFYKEEHIKTQSKKKDVLVIFALQETNELQFIWQKLFQRERPIEYVNYK